MFTTMLYFGQVFGINIQMTLTLPLPPSTPQTLMTHSNSDSDNTHLSGALIVITIAVTFCARIFRLSFASQELLYNCQTDIPYACLRMLFIDVSSRSIDNNTASCFTPVWPMLGEFLV